MNNVLIEQKDIQIRWDRGERPSVRGEPEGQVILHTQKWQQHFQEVKRRKAVGPDKTAIEMITALDELVIDKVTELGAASNFYSRVFKN